MGTCASVHNGTAPESAMKLDSKKDKLVTPESPINDNKHSTANPPIKTFGDFVWRIKAEALHEEIFYSILVITRGMADWGPGNVSAQLSVLCWLFMGLQLLEDDGCSSYLSAGKEESFLIARAWIDSDCEDDFYSILLLPVAIPQSTIISLLGPHLPTKPFGGRPPGSELEPSPLTEKRLSDLFKDRIREDRDADGLQTSGPGDENIADGKVEVKQTILDVLPKSAITTPYLSERTSVCSSERLTNGDALSEKEKSFKSTQRCLPSLIFCRSFSERKKKSPAIAV
uniref:Uncharacterized protein n=1 Tax=Salix viminalis TaxID=40686 RepID=A0A6N2MEQ0_SALVM